MDWTSFSIAGIKDLRKYKQSMSFCTYKPYACCHRRPHGGDGTPTQPALTPLFAARRPLLKLIPCFLDASSNASSTHHLKGRSFSIFTHPSSPRSAAIPAFPGRPPASSSPLMATHTKPQHYELAAPTTLYSRPDLPLPRRHCYLELQLR
jgi:hypothetical protein